MASRILRQAQYKPGQVTFSGGFPFFAPSSPLVVASLSLLLYTGLRFDVCHILHVLLCRGKCVSVRRTRFPPNTPKEGENMEDCLSKTPKRVIIRKNVGIVYQIG